MNLLIDESLNFRLLNACQSAGISFICVKDFMRGAPDIEIINYSFTNESIIVTEDKDFGELIFKQNLRPYGVVFLRYSPSETADVSIALFKCLTEQLSNLPGNFIAITPHNTRINSL